MSDPQPTHLSTQTHSRAHTQSAGQSASPGIGTGTGNTIAMSSVVAGDAEREAVLRVLDSGRYVNGPELRAFEQAFAEDVGVAHAIGVNSCTSALQLALMALGVGPGDEVLVPDLTAFCTVEPVMHVGAIPVFVAPDAQFCMDPEDAARKITPRTKVMLPVHLYGHPADMEALLALANEHGIAVVEDCAQAHGARIGSKPVGALGVASCFSFYPSKNLTVCGDGGMVATDDPELAATVRMLRNHGRDGRHEHRINGFNMRLSEMPAAVGRVQLARLPGFNARRRELAAMYDALLADCPVATPTIRDAGSEHVYHLYVIRTQQRDRLQVHLRADGVETNIHFPIPCSRQPAALAVTDQTLPETAAVCETILSLPMHPGLRNEDVEAVCRSIQTFFEKEGWQSPAPFATPDAGPSMEPGMEGVLPAFKKGHQDETIIG